MKLHNHAEDIFNKDINQTIKAEIVANHGKEENIIFKGKLVNIQCNQFFIENENGFIEMFRYEDLINLIVINK